MRPRKVNILGKVYSIEYCNSVMEVDESEQQPLAGCVLLRENRIRILDGGDQDANVWHVLLHEIIEAIVSELSIKSLAENHDDLDRMACTLADTLLRNRWLKQ